MHYVTPETAEHYLGFLPTGARRGVEALALDRIAETFFSRSVFLDMNWVALRENGVWGVGPGRFRYYAPALATVAGYDLRGWIDNSNNFYLGVVAEFGILGAGVMLLAALRRRGSSSMAQGDGAVVFCLLALLITGPHVEAPEVALIYSMVLGILTLPRIASIKAGAGISDGLAVLKLCGLGIVVIGAAVAETTRDRGVYGWEREGHGMHQWLSPVASVERFCNCEGHAGFVLEVARASSDKPVEVEIRNGNGESVTRVFTRLESKN